MVEALAWIRSFLADRHQVVKVEWNQRSAKYYHREAFLVPTVCTVHQCHDLPEVVRGILYLFADDTKLLKAVTSRQDSILLQNDINALEEWSKIWLLRFHPKKCHVLKLGKFDNIRHEHPYQLGDTVLEHVFSKKDLGVIFDSDLSFEKHILAQVRKANSMVGLIKRSFFHLSHSLFR